METTWDIPKLVNYGNTSGDHYIVKSTYPIWTHDGKGNAIWVVKTIRLRDQYEIEEPVGMFLWEWERLN
jgi:hypothetical protein